MHTLWSVNMADNATESVCKLEDILKDKSSEDNTVKGDSNVKKTSKRKKKNIVVPKGARRSGRFWKSERDK